jgi:type IV pilus assembly protein PilV
MRLDCASAAAPVCGEYFITGKTPVGGSEIVLVWHQKNGCKRTGGGYTRPLISGFSLLEVLVASTVFSLGLAGFAAILLVSMIGSAEARREAIASTAASSLSDQIRMNRHALDRYLNPPEYISRMCSGDSRCTPEQQADFDFSLWQLNLSDSIPNARGLVCRDQTPQDGDIGDSHCDGSGPVVIKIFWNSQGKDEQGQPRRKRFTLGIS